MKKKTLLSVLIISAFLLSGFALAGVEPSPWEPEINQLGAVENGLNSCLQRINKVLGMPPDDLMPSPNINGAVNRLEAIDGQLNSLNDFIANIVLSVLGFDPSPFREDVIMALQQVKGVNNQIILSIDTFLALPPDDIHPDFLSAIQNVYGSADMINYTVETSINDLEGGGGACVPTDLSESACLGAGCQWITDVPAGEPFCCCPPAE